MDIENWHKKHRYSPEQLALARTVLEEVRGGRRLDRSLRSHPSANGELLAKHMLIAAYKQLVESGEWPEDPELLSRIRMKPVRTLSGVTTVTVLTKDFPCPGRCIFCPSEMYMPKSYLIDEPGAARAYQNKWTPTTRSTHAFWNRRPLAIPPTRSNCSSSAAQIGRAHV